MIKIKDLSVGFGNKKILNGISMNVHPGEIVGIIGHNGAGKSTLLKSIFGLLPVWKGSVVFNGQSIHNKKPNENVANGLSLVLQGGRVFTEMTVLENIEISGFLVSQKKELLNRMEYIFKIFPELQKKKGQLAMTLSGGEQQKLAFSNALLMKPKALLLDEPSLGLSPKSFKLTFDVIKDINKKLGTSILIVEQRVKEVLKIVDRVYVIKLGQVAFEGHPHELVEDQTKMKKLFL